MYTRIGLNLRLKLLKSSTKTVNKIKFKLLFNKIKLKRNKLAKTFNKKPAAAASKSKGKLKACCVVYNQRFSKVFCF